MPLFTLFFTVYATWWSSFAFLGSTSYFYTKGPVYLTAIAWNILFGVLFYVLGKRIWHYGKNRAYITPTDFFDDIFQSKLLNAVITITMLLFTLPYLQIQLSGGAYLIEVASDGLIPWRVSGLIFYIVIIIYLWAGGLRAVAWTDIFYSILIFVGMLTGGLYLTHVAGGLEVLIQTLTDENQYYFLLPGPEGDSGILLWLSMFIITPLGALMGPQLWIRMYSAESHRTFSLMPFLFSFAAIAYMGSVLAGYSGILLNPELERSDLILPVMLMKYATPWLAAFLFCCGAAAALSTANSQIHAISAIYSMDIHKRLIHSRISDRSLVMVGRWSILSFSALAYVVLIQSPTLIIQTGLIALSGTAQIIIPTLGALLWRKSNATGAAFGVLAGLVILVICTFAFHIKSSYGGFMGLCVNTAVFVLFSLLSKPNPAVSERIQKYKQDYDACYE